MACGFRSFLYEARRANSGGFGISKTCAEFAGAGAWHITPIVEVASLWRISFSKAQILPMALQCAVGVPKFLTGRTCDPAEIRWLRVYGRGSISISTSKMDDWN